MHRITIVATIMMLAGYKPIGQSSREQACTFNGLRPRPLCQQDTQSVLCFAMPGGGGGGGGIVTSRAVQPPWPRLGVMGWKASPARVTAPVDRPLPMGGHLHANALSCVMLLCHTSHRCLLLANSVTSNYASTMGWLYVKSHVGGSRLGFKSLLHLHGFNVGCS